MPKEKDFRDDRIVALFSELQNGKAVSRALGVHEQTIYQVLRRAKGVCIRCSSPIAAGKKSCEKCLAFDRGRIKTLRKARARLGVCQQCGKERSSLSRQYCDEHRIAHLERNETHETKKKARGSPNGEVGNLRQKRRSLKALHGDNAVACLEESGYKCEICGAVHTDVSLHIHHIDEDRKNNKRENFIALCFTCHTATHNLLRLKKPKSFIGWFRRTYPKFLSR